MNNKTTSRVEGESVERLTTLHHSSVSIHVDSGENERKKESGRMGQRRLERNGGKGPPAKNTDFTQTD